MLHVRRWPVHAQCMEQGAKASALGQPRGMGGEGGGGRGAGPHTTWEASAPSWWLGRQVRSFGVGVSPFWSNGSIIGLE